MNRLLHRTAWLIALVTFPLIFMGGLVTSKQAGLSVPDWPNSYGYNMFLFPPRLWIGGIKYEHMHRLLGSLVGMLAIVAVIIAWRTETRRWVRWLSVGVLAAISLQGAIGGMRVVLVNLSLAIVHGCLAQAVFCLIVFFCIVTSRWWEEAPHQSGSGIGRGLIPLAVVCFATIYLQLMIGATMRHYRAGLAIPDVPTTYGRWIPPTTDAQMAADNLQRASLNLEPVSIGQVWLAFVHRIGACVVSAELIALIALVVVRYRQESKLFRPAVLLAVLLTTQVTLGILTVLWRKPADIATAHVACGALVLATTFLMAVRAMRLYSHTIWRTVRSRTWPAKNKIGLNVSEPTVFEGATV
jgi:cytochrome c oxidase assembly protein subunit 15